MGTNDTNVPSFDEMQSDVPYWARDEAANKGSGKDDWRPVGREGLPDAPWVEYQGAKGNLPSFDEMEAQSKPPFDPNKPSEAWPGTPRNTSPLLSGAEGAVQGAITGATAGWRPELEKLSRASGLPEMPFNSADMLRMLITDLNASLAQKPARAN